MRWTPVVVVGVALLLAITPISATTTTATASIYTTDTELSNGTLDGVRVVGTGADANVTLRTGIFDSFERGQFATNWSGDTGQWNVDSSLSYHRETAISRTCCNPSNATINRSVPNATPENVSWAYRHSSVTGISGHAYWTLENAGDRVIRIRINQNGRLQYRATNGAWADLAFTVNRGQWYRIAIEDIDYQNGNFHVSVYAPNGTRLERSFILVEFLSSNTQIDDFTMSTNQTIRFDAIANAQPAEQGMYVGQAHTADNITAGFANFTIHRSSANVTVYEDAGNGYTPVNSTTFAATGSPKTINTTVDIPTTKNPVKVGIAFSELRYAGGYDVLYDEGTQFENAEPVIENRSPADGFRLDTDGVTLEAGVSDRTFGLSQSESVDVTFQTQSPTSNTWTDQATVTLNGNNTASTSLSNLQGGRWEWRVVAADSYNGQTTSSARQFNVPDTLFIRNVTNHSQLINTANVSVQFFGNDEIINRTTSSGTVSLTDLPVSQTLVVTVDAPDYYKRTTILDNIYDNNQSVYLLNNTVPTYEVRFTITDRTGEFAPEDSQIRIERPVLVGLNTTWVTVAGDEHGVEGFTTDLEQNQRYRIRVTNEDGDDRLLGSYTPRVSETVNLVIGQVSAVPVDSNNEFTYNASYTNVSGTNYVRVEYNDSANLTSKIWVEVHERGNSSNVLLANSSTTGTFGSFSVTQQVPADEKDTDWVAIITVDRNGTRKQFRVPVGPQRRVLGGMAGWLKALLSIGSIFVVAGLFSKLNGDIGGLVVAGMGGMFWYVDLMPEGVGIGVVTLAMVLAAIIFINERRGEAGL